MWHNCCARSGNESKGLDLQECDGHSSPRIAEQDALDRGPLAVRNGLSKQGQQLDFTFQPDESLYPTLPTDDLDKDLEAAREFKALEQFGSESEGKPKTPNIQSQEDLVIELEVPPVREDSTGNLAPSMSSPYFKAQQEQEQNGMQSPSAGSARALMSESEETDVPLTCSERIDDFLNNSIFWSIFVCFLTIWALYIDDFKVLVLPKSIDTVIFIVNLVILGVFVLEFILCWITQPGYACSLGAFMDFLAAASLIPFQELLSEFGDIGDNISVARVARAARALRILRSMRAAAMALKTEARMRKMRKILNKNEKEVTSVLEDTLQKSTNTKMLLGILCILLGTTLLDYTAPDNTAESGLVLLDRMYPQRSVTSVDDQSKKSWTTVWHDYQKSVEGMRSDALQNLMVLTVWEHTYLEKDINDLRKNDLQTFKAGNSTMPERSRAVVSVERMNRRRAVLSLLSTNFCVIVIMCWTWSFRRDHQTLVILPVKRMIEILRSMAMDPRKAVETVSEKKIKLDEQATEMEVIENCIGRFGGLLKVGFGEAGMRIIERSLNSEEFDPVIPGHIVLAVFGFCDIRNFTDCCEVLKKDTMIFTNGVAQIVHNLVSESGGVVNKNIGDAFLSVWKLTETEATDEAEAQQSKTGFPSPKRSVYTHHLTGAANACDGSLRAFLKMNEELKTSPSIQELSRDPRLQKKLPGYRVRMGSGLHLGWAIEGAVGSSHKVDATYLSPHVNMASRLEAATKQYGVNILMSDALVNAFGPELQAECRPIDRVTVKGSEVPLTLFVHMPSESPELREEDREAFMDLWSEAFNLYISGTDWKQAESLMRQCLQIFPRDEAAKVLLEVIQEAGGTAPDKWPGYRALTSK